MHHTSAAHFHKFLVWFGTSELGIPRNANGILALSCEDNYINLFLGQFPRGESLESTVFLDAIIFIFIFLHWHRLLANPALR